MSEFIEPVLFILHLQRRGRKWLTLNTQPGSRGEVFAERDAKLDWRQETMIAVRQAKCSGPYPPAILQAEFVFNSNRRRDAHNFTPTLKPCIDQMVSMGFWKDDTPEFITVPDPILHLSRLIEGIVITATRRPL